MLHSKELSDNTNSVMQKIFGFLQLPNYNLNDFGTMVLQFQSVEIDEYLRNSIADLFVDNFFANFTLLVNSNDFHRTRKYNGSKGYNRIGRYCAGP